MDSVSVIVLNWNGWRDTIRCLRSLYATNYNNYHIIVVDNGSTDDSVIQIMGWAFRNELKVFMIKEDDAINGFFEEYNLFRGLSCDKRLVLILSRFNRGYSGGMNLGLNFVLKTLKPDYVLLLNNDTLVDSSLLSKLIKVMKQNSRIAVVGPKVLHYVTESVVPIEQYILPIPFAYLLKRFFKNVALWEKNIFDDKIYFVNRLDGSCFLVRATVLGEIGLFNESFFSYWEDTDFFLRVKRRGYFIAFVPCTFIRHRIGSSNIAGLKMFHMSHLSPFAYYMMCRNVVHVIKLYYSGIRMVVLFVTQLLWIFYFLFTAVVYFRNFCAVKASLLGFIKGLLGEKGRPPIEYWKC